MKYINYCKKTAIYFLCISLIVSTTFISINDTYAQPEVQTEEEIFNEVIIEPIIGGEYDGFIVSIKDNAIDDVNDNDLSEELPSIGNDKYYLVETTHEALMIASAEAIEFVEPNYLRSVNQSVYPPNDEFYKDIIKVKYDEKEKLFFVKSWDDENMSMDGQKKVYEYMGINSLWEEGYDGTGVSVAVLDSGFNSHADMGNLSKVLISHNENDGSVVESSPGNDDGKHGTLVTSLIGAAYNNNKGIAGIASGADITSINVFTYEEMENDGKPMASSWSLANAYTYLLQDGNTPDVVNMSYGGTGYTEIEEYLLSQLESRGCLLIASAGNDGVSENIPENVNGYQAPQYPSGFSSVIGVGALDSNLDIVSFSTKNADVDISAWGSSIPVLYSNGTDTVLADGTSLSSPIVTGIAACLKQINPDIDKDTFLNLLNVTADDKGPEGWDAGYGYGVVDADAMMNVLLNGNSFCTVNFYVNGGTTTDKTSKICITGSKLKRLPKVKRQGYIFDGWYTSLSGGKKVSENTIVTDDMSLYARWIKVEKKVFNASKNKIIAPSIVKAGKTFSVTLRGEDDTKIAKYDGEMKYVPIGLDIGKNRNNLQYGTSLDIVMENVKTNPITKKIKLHSPGDYKIFAEFDEWVFSSEDGNPMWDSTGDKVYTITKKISVQGKVKFNVGKRGKLKKKKQKTRYVKEKGKVGSLPKVKAKKGYKFTGWYTKQKGGQKITKKTKIKFKSSSTKTYYAHYKKV